MQPLRKNEEGQVIVEFVIVFGMISTLIFLFVQMSWGIAFGHYTHYATFMASRAYLAAGATQADQYEAAATVLKQTLKSGGKDILPFLAPSRSGGERDASGSEPVKGAMVGTHPEAMGKEHSRLYSWAEGVQYNFNLRMFLLPISAFVAKGGQGQNIHPGVGRNAKTIEFKGVIPFTSDSFLGREPSVSECFEELHRLSGTDVRRGDNADFIEDNGC
ncbi:MAG: TadE/TadG family type IV pilus assembly protein [Bdellovibrionota bacterium]